MLDLRCLDRADMGALRHVGLLRVGRHRFRVALAGRTAGPTASPTAGPAKSTWPSSTLYQVTPLGHAPLAQAHQIGRLLDARHRQLQAEPAVFGSLHALRHGCEALAELHHADTASGNAIQRQASASRAEPILRLLAANAELVCEGRRYGVRVHGYRITVIRTDLPADPLLRFFQALRDLFARGCVVSRARAMERMLQAARKAHDQHLRTMVSVAAPSVPSAHVPVELSARDFERAHWRGRDLAGVTLRTERAQWRHCSLAGARMPRVSMTRIRWDWLDLSRTNAMHAAMRGMDVQNGCFAGANLIGADLREIRLVNVDLSRATLAAAALCKSGFFTCKAAGANFDGADLQGCHFQTCDLTGASFRGAKLGNARFHACQLAGADFSAADLSLASLHGGVARGARFDGANLHEVSLGDGQCLESLCLDGVKAFSMRFSGPYTGGEYDYLVNCRSPDGGSLLKRIAAFRGDSAHKVAMIRPIAVALLAQQQERRGDGASLAQLYNELFPSVMDIVAADDACLEDGDIQALRSDYASWLLNAGATALVGWKDSHATLGRCLMYAMVQTARYRDYGLRHSAGIMQLVFRAQADDVPAAVKVMADTLEAVYLNGFTDALRQRIDEARNDVLVEPQTFALMDGSGCRALLIMRDYFLNRLLGKPLAGPKKGFQWAEYLVVERRADAEPAWDLAAEVCPARDFHPFPLLASAFGAGMQDQTRASYLDSLRLGKYRARFDAAFRQSRLKHQALVTMSHQTALGQIFAPLFDNVGEGSGYRLSAPRLADAHVEAILAIHGHILGDARKSPRGRAYLFLCLAMQFVRLSSDGRFGTDDSSPNALRFYAGALLNKACELDAAVRDWSRSQRWMNSLCGGSADTPVGEYFTCTTMLYGNMREYATRLIRENAEFASIHATLWPKAWL